MSIEDKTKDYCPAFVFVGGTCFIEGVECNQKNYTNCKTYQVYIGSRIKEAAMKQAIYRENLDRKKL